MKSSLNPHPRLYIGPAAIARARAAPRDPVSKAAAAVVDADALAFAADPRFPWSPFDGHNAHLIRARLVQIRVFTLLAAWIRAGDDRYRAAVLGHVSEMGKWEHWSWIAWRQGQDDADDIFDLSYGENCATLAVAYDLLANSLGPAEKRMFLDIASRRALSSFRRHTAPAHRAWWLNRPDCNWQSVCAGGGGLLALAMAGDLPDMKTLIDRADEAVLRYMKKADEYHGGCVEGLGYWNYGMRYAFMYLLSHEAATGKPHPALALPGSHRTLRFPLDITPSGVPCGFGDINHPWRPLAFHYAAADRFHDARLVAALDERLPLPTPDTKRGSWAEAPELLFLRPRNPAGKKAPRSSHQPLLHLYPGMDWGVLASSPDRPRLAATVRGGTTECPHSHLDLFSYHLVSGGEAMVTSVSNRGYVDTTFSNRRYDIWEMRPDAKNTILIGGAGLSKPASVKTKAIRIGSFHGFRVTGPDACRIVYTNVSAVRDLSRLFLMWKDRLFVVIDRVDLRAPNQIESRFHTFTQVALDGLGAVLKGKKAVMRAAFAGTAPLVARCGMGTPSDPSAPVSTMVRIFTQKLESSLTLATVFSAGPSPARAEFVRGPRRALILRVRGRGYDFSLSLPFTQPKETAHEVHD